jgi:hypothetical protein
LQNSSASYVLTSVMLVPKNVKDTTLTTARDAHKHAATALKNVEEWQDRLGKKTIPLFSFKAVLSFLCCYDHHS